MSLALLTGATGLLAHQRKLEVVANNLANLNTIGYKSQRILFGDLLYNNMRPASSGDGVTTGGTNPQQIGVGVGIAQMGRNFSQGVLSSTGSQFDFAIDGDGYFVLSNGEKMFTRAGAFSLDSSGFLVDPATGAKVQRFGGVGEGLDGNPKFQVSGDNSIRIPLGSSIAGKLTSSIGFLGNLPASAEPPKAEILTSYKAYQVAGAPATTSTLLNDLDSNLTDYTTGDKLRLQGFDFRGNPLNATLDVSATTTLGDMVNFYNSVLVDAVASLDASGNLVVQANGTGESKHKLELSDEPGNTGSMDTANHLLVETVKGTDGDTQNSTLQIFDTRGQAHSVDVELRKKDANTWDATFSLMDSSGTMIDSIVNRIEFAETGGFLAVRGAGDGDSNIELKFNSISTNQEISIDFGKLTHLAKGFTVSSDQDGYPPGSLVNVAISASGVLEGMATNGKKVPIAQLAIANFANNEGLEANGQNYFRETFNSGVAQIDATFAGKNGSIRGGQLESSNVDVALEFTQLIVAQRGFSANARSITVASEILQELNNLLR
jgi:flagellar hook protein FlgE